MRLHHAAFLAAGATLLFAHACTLDFGRWEGELPAGGDGGTPVGGSGAVGGIGGEPVGGGGDQGGGGGLPGSCTNMMMDGDETGVDCGGGTCPGCPNGDPCNVFDDCVSLFCSGDTCAPCATDANCADAADTWCDTDVMGGMCVPKKDDGDSCGGANECTSGNCVDDVCCDGPCDGNCESCVGTETTGASGTCSPIVGTTDPDDECTDNAEPQVCNGGNMCVGLCGLEPSPPGGMCPMVCSGGCIGGLCTIDCGLSNCNAVTCPAGFACSVVCSGNMECVNAVINCPESYACDVTCSGNKACEDATINCASTGTCDLSCSADQNVCSGTTLNCGDNDCGATCTGASTPSVMCPAVPPCACTTC